MQIIGNTNNYIPHVLSKIIIYRNFDLASDRFVGFFLVRTERGEMLPDSQPGMQAVYRFYRLWCDSAEYRITEVPLAE